MTSLNPSSFGALGPVAYNAGELTPGTQGHQLAVSYATFASDLLHFGADVACAWADYCGVSGAQQARWLGRLVASTSKPAPRSDP